jgi:DNA-binding response OmpR family regulator
VASMIMVVDDDTNVLRLVELMLNRVRCTVVTLNEPLEAVDLLTSVTPNLFIVDQMMPRMSGFELCRHIRLSTATAQTPIIMLSALYEPKSVSEGLQAGANVYLPKSALHSDLLEHVRVLLDMENARC